MRRKELKKGKKEEDLPVPVEDEQNVQNTPNKLGKKEITKSTDKKEKLRSKIREGNDKKEQTPSQASPRRKDTQGTSDNIVTLSISL